MTEAVTSYDRSDRNPTINAPATDTPTMRRLFGLAVAVAFVGWLDTAFLAGLHYAVLPLPEGAPVAGTGWAVLTSEWSYLLGVPTALYGAGYYLLAIALGMVWLTGRVPHVERVVPPLTVLGIGASAIFVYLQLFVIQAICPFCMISAVTTTALLLIGIGIYRSSEAATLGDLGTAGLDRRTVAWPIVFVVVVGSLLAMIHLAAVAPLPVPGA